MDRSSYRPIPLFPFTTKLENNITVPCLYFLTSHSLFKPLDSGFGPMMILKPFQGYQRTPFYQIRWSVLDVRIFDFSTIFPVADHSLLIVLCSFGLQDHPLSGLPPPHWPLCLHNSPLFLIFPILDICRTWGSVAGPLLPSLFPLSFSIFCPSISFLLILSFFLLSYTLDQCF